MKKLGIIGGASWASTVLYYEQINRGVAARLGGLHSALIAMESVDFGPIVELQHADDWDGIGSILVDAAKRLRSSGVDGVLIASNTLHKCYDRIAREVPVPLLHIADSTAAQLAADGRSLVALLGTRFTMNEPHVRSRIEARGVHLVPIDIDWQREVDRIIFAELAAGRVVRTSQRKLKTLITEMAKAKAQAIVLGCTELVLAVDTRANVLPVYDSTALHARAAVEWMLGEREAERVAA